MILMMGIAGAGKGTQCQLLAERKGFQLVTMGDVVRANVSEEQKEKMLNGILLDDNEIIAMVDKVLSAIPADQEVILDGFPRTIPQAEWLMEQVNSGRYQLDAAFHLVATREAVKERLLGRARADDKEDAIEKRFDEYEKSTSPLLNWLKGHGVKLIDINAEQPVEEVHQDIVSHLG